MNGRREMEQNINVSGSQKVKVTQAGRDVIDQHTEVQIIIHKDTAPKTAKRLRKMA